MTYNLDRTPLSDLCEAIVDCEHKTAPKQDFGIPSIRTTDIKNGRLDIENANRVSEETYIQWTARLEPQPNDLILAREAPVGEVGIVPLGQRVCLGQRTVLIRPDKNKLFPRYLLYLLLTSQMRHALTSRAEGSVVPHLNMSAIRGLELPLLPPLDEQKAIAHILGTLDDKIELNQQTNQTLEAIARALFKSWFIDFDPVRAKLDGRQPAGMDAETAALFPAEFEDSALGKIPKDWKVQIIGDVIEFAYGKPLKQPDRQHGIVPVYGSNGQIGWHNKSLVKAPGIVIGRKGNPGTVVWTPIDFYPIDTTFYAIPISSTKSLHYLFHALCLQDLPSLAADSAVPGLNRNLAYMNKLLIPSEECLEAFDSIVNGISAKVHITNQEAITLTSIRDALLPKLLSGEIRVQDAETVVEAVT